MRHRVCVTTAVVLVADKTVVHLCLGIGLESGCVALPCVCGNSSSTRELDSSSCVACVCV